MKHFLTGLAMIGICCICTAQENTQLSDAQGRPLPAPVHRLAAGEVMTFPYGTNLEWCVRMSFDANGIQNPYTTPITGSLIEQIRHISCYSPVPKVPDIMFNTNNNNSVTSLEGIEYFHNLETITINGSSEITDLYPLSGLEKLTKVDIKNSKLTDISPLQSNTRLQRVILDNNSITDLSPLTAHKALREVSLRYQAPGYITDISPLAGKIALTSIDLQGNKIESIQPLANSYLRILNIRDNRVTSIEPLRTVRTLEKFTADINQITDLTPLSSSLASLHVISVAHNNISSLEFITGPMPVLSSLNVSDNQISDISPITKIEPRGQRKLELFLDQNNITDISMLNDLANLKMIYTLRLSYNCIADTEHIRFLHDKARIPNVTIGRQCIDRPPYTEENTSSQVVNRDLILPSQ